MEATLKVLNDLVASGIVERYAIGGLLELSIRPLPDELDDVTEEITRRPGSPAESS